MALRLYAAAQRRQLNQRALVYPSACRAIIHSRAKTAAQSRQIPSRTRGRQSIVPQTMPGCFFRLFYTVHPFHALSRIFWPPVDHMALPGRRPCVLRHHAHRRMRHIHFFQIGRLFFYQFMAVALAAPSAWENFVIPTTGAVTLVSNQASAIFVMETPFFSASPQSLCRPLSLFLSYFNFA